MQKLFSMIVVDDEPTILSGLCDLYPWNNWGFEVVGAYLTADSALEALHGSLTDVVLTDIRMPGMDGLSFASMLSRAFPAACVVLMSAYDDFEYIRQAMRSGVIEYLVKPVRYDQIVSTFMKVHRILSKADTPPDKLSNASDNEYHQQIVRYVRSYVEPSNCNAGRRCRKLWFHAGAYFAHFSSVLRHHIFGLSGQPAYDDGCSDAFRPISLSQGCRLLGRL